MVTSIDNLVTRAHLSPAVTSPELMAAITAHWGAPTIDLAATATDTVASEYISPEEDSLKANWSERIGRGMGYLNPPSGDISPWARKCFQTHGHILLLVPAAIDADWWWLYVQGVARVHILSPRPTYDGLPIPMCIAEYVGLDCHSSFQRWKWREEAL